MASFMYFSVLNKNSSGKVTNHVTNFLKCFSKSKDNRKSNTVKVKNLTNKTKIQSVG